MTTFTVTLFARVGVSASLTVEAVSVEEARTIALGRANEAPWPMDEAGETIIPADQQAPVIVASVWNDATDEEIVSGDACPPDPVASDMLDALRDWHRDLMQTASVSDAGNAAIAAQRERVGVLIARAEGRA